MTDSIKVKDVGIYSDMFCLLCGNLPPAEGDDEEKANPHICQRCAKNLLACRYQGVAHLLDHGMINVAPFNDIDYADLRRHNKDDEG